MSSRSFRLLDQVEHLLGRDGVGRSDQVAEEAQFGAGLYLAAHVNLRSGHMADQHRRQPGTDALRGERLHFFRDFLLDCRRNRRPIENFWHQTLPSNRIVSGLDHDRPDPP